MKATATNLLKFLQGTKQFIIPIYQRTYTWGSSDCQQLWDDILRVAEDSTIPVHFVGSIVYIEKGIHHISSVTQLKVIDGQQRLTTLSLLLAALGEVLDEQRREKDIEITHRKIRNYYLLNADEDGDARYKLILTQSDKDTLIYILEGQVGARPSPFSSRIYDNYNFFKDQIHQSGLDPVVLYRGISKLIMVDISLEQGQDNPQLIFESLNSTGVDLSQADLIRNYILMGLDTTEQTKLYKRYWHPMEQDFMRADGIKLFDRFMRDYLTVKQGIIPNIDAVYNGFKAYHRTKYTTPISEIVADIYRYAQYFVNMVFLHEQDREIKSLLSDISALKTEVVYPFLLEVYDDYAQKLLSKEDFLAILRLIESYVFRRMICGLPSHGLNKLFASLARDINKEHYVKSVQAALLQKGLSGRFPSNEEFSAAFVVKDVYRFRNRNYLLDKLENYGTKEGIRVEAYTIEHILPQNEQLSTVWQQELGPDWKEIQARYLHTIGNLTLTGYNSELSDRPFQEKRDMKGGFADSPIRLNQSLKQVEHWNREEIVKRAVALAEIAVKVWTFPEISPQQAREMEVALQKEPLTVLVGPAKDALAGEIPEGYKIVQMGTKKFYYFRMVNREWVAYGNGKAPWYAISWETAGRWVRDFHKRDVKPFLEKATGVDTSSLLKAVASESLTDDNEAMDNGHKNYTLADHPSLQGTMFQLFEQLRKRILNLDVSVREEIKKHYIIYKTTSNFTDIEPQKKRLKVTLNIPFSEIDDPKRLCRDLKGVGHHGNGDVEVSVTQLEQLDDVMDLVRQAFERFHEESYA